MFTPLRPIAGDVFPVLLQRHLDKRLPYLSCLSTRHRLVMHLLAVLLQILAPEADLAFQRVLVHDLDKPRKHATHDFPGPNFALILTDDDDLMKSFQFHAKRVHASIASPTRPVYLAEISRECWILELFGRKVRCRRRGGADVYDFEWCQSDSVRFVCVHDDGEAHCAADGHTILGLEICVQSQHLSHVAVVRRHRLPFHLAGPRGTRAV